MKRDHIPRLLTPPQSSFDIHSTQTASKSSSIVPHSTNVDKRPRFYAIFARMTNISYFPRIRMFVDTGAVMNTGSLEYHLWVMSYGPGIVETYLRCGSDTAYDAVHLLASIDLKETNQDVDHGKMTAFIWYKKPYMVKGYGPFILPFVLEHDVSFRCILILPTLLSIGAAIDLLSGELDCTQLDRNFPLTLDPPGKGLPDGTTLNRSLSFIPPGVSTNTTPTTSLLKYTYSDGTPNPLWIYTPSKNLDVKDLFFLIVFPVNFLSFIQIHYNPIFSN